MDANFAPAGSRLAGANGSLPTGLRLEVKSTGSGVLAWLPGDQVKEVADSPWATHDEVMVGELNWGPTGMVTWVSVPYDEMKRRGIATAMWSLGKTVEPRLHHSQDQSASGHAWGERTAMPSWRNRSEMDLTQYDVAIVPDTGMGSRRLYDVTMQGYSEARFPKRQQAVDFVEQVFGPVQWEKVPVPKQMHDDPVWGPTEEFDDTGYLMVVRHAPRLAPSVAQRHHALTDDEARMQGRYRTEHAQEYRSHATRTKQDGPWTLLSIPETDDPGYYEIFALSGDRVVGWSSAGPWGTVDPNYTEMAITVDPDFRRRGVATAMYRFAEEVTGHPTKPGENHSDAAEALWNQPHRPFGRTSALVTQDYEGQVGNRDHITRVQTGTVPTAAIANLNGYAGETPGAHRLRQGKAWEDFKADIAANGIQDPIFICVDPYQEPRILEGNHRRDAAVELGLPEVPVEIRYFGHAENTASRIGSVGDYGGRHQTQSPDSGYGVWADNLMDGSMLPDDWVQHPDYYTGFRQWVGPVVRALQGVQGNPNGMLTIYRALPAEQQIIENGNWVTLSKEYAIDHGESGNACAVGGKWHIISATVSAHQVAFGGDDLMEWAYFGPTVMGTEVTSPHKRTASKMADLSWNDYMDGRYVARGFKLDVTSGHLAKAFIDGTVTAQQIADAAHTLTGTVGGWWGVLDNSLDRNFDLVGIADFASSEDTLREMQEQGMADSVIHGEVMVVLIGKRPLMPDGTPWDPTEHNDLVAGGLMGNSFLKEHFDTVDLVAVRYNAGWGWKEISASGIRVKASVEGLSVTAAKTAALVWRKESGDYDQVVYRADSPIGTYEIDGNNPGRNHWTIIYPSKRPDWGEPPDYGMVDTLAEAKAWAEMDLESRVGKQAALVTAEADVEDGVMVALVPPLDVARALVQDDLATEPLDNQHVTLVYLGKAVDVDEALLLATVEKWAADSQPLVGKIRGYGTFDNGDEHVLYAAWNFDGGAGWRQGLKDALEDVGIEDASSYKDQDWTPHETLAYTDEPITALPVLPDGLPEQVTFASVVVAYKDRWASFALTGGPAEVA